MISICSFCGKSWNYELYGPNSHYSKYVWETRKKRSELTVCPLCYKKQDVQDKIEKINEEFKKLGEKELK